MRILITGINGFVGRMLAEEMLVYGWDVRGTIRSRQKLESLPRGVEGICIGPMTLHTDWSLALEGVDTVVHLAALVHVLNESGADRLAEFRGINVDSTERLARTAALSGVRRFVLMSSIKVNGEGRTQAYTEQDDVSPADSYAISKWEAEQVLKRVAGETGMEVVILRPPLVYGPGVKANFFNLIEIVHRGFPLPLSNVNNKRSFIYLGNLANATISCIVNPQAAGQTYLISDGEDVSSPELVRKIATALGQPARLIPVPLSLLRFAGKIIGNSSAVERLLGSLSIDISKIRRELGWIAPFTMTQGLKETADWYLSRNR